MPYSTTSLQFALDTTGRLEAPQGWLTLTGWLAGSGAPACLIRLRLENGTAFDCESGLPRPDVAAAFPSLPGAASSGFRLNTHVPAGLLIGTLEYLPAGTEAWLPACTVTILAGVSPLHATLEAYLPTTIPAGPRHLHGWCFHPQETIAEVRLRFGQQTVLMKHGHDRPDLATAYAHHAGAPTAGFSGDLDFQPGRGDLVLTARLHSGQILRHVLASGLEVPDAALARATLAAHEARARALSLPDPTGAKVSIVIPIYNQLAFTLGCLESLDRHQGQTRFEVIIIDDNSDPEVAQVLGQVSHLRLHRNPANRGFVLNCNHGAAMAQGEYLLFLNNDTEVQAGWLESMLQVFEQRPKAGLVGAKLIYPDGRLQEAGNIIGADGSGWNYGRGDDPARPEYNYLRQADYCSGACLLIPRPLFVSVGGFDERYIPAYYEDTDLAFAVRATGREVYYQPAATVVHFEGVSSGTDVSKGVKRHQVVNREKFARKWADVLIPYSADPSVISVARDRHAPCRILILDACALTPDADSGSLRMFNLLLMLAREGSKVTFAATNLQLHEPFSTQLRLAGVEHLHAPHVCELKPYLEAQAHAFDVIILSRKAVALEFIDIVRQAAPGARVVFDTVDLMYLRLERQAELEQSGPLRAEAERSKAIELALCAKSDLVFVVSPVEAGLLGQHVDPGKIALVSNIHALQASPAGPAERQGVMFVGGFQHPPNVDAMVFFLDHVLPLLEPRLPGLEIHVVGSNLPPELRQRANPYVHMHGFVADLEPFYRRIRLTIAPLRYGAGVKGKVNQSMAHGVPVVATTMAVEGMHLVHERDVLVADDAPAFADAIVRLHEDEVLWTRIAAGGLRNIEQHFSFQAVQAELFRALGPELFLRQGTDQPLPLKPAAPYVLGEKIRFQEGGNAEPYKRQGWAPPESNSSWLVGRKASLEFQLAPGAEPRRVTALVYPFLFPPELTRQRLLMMTPDGSTVTVASVEDASGPVEISWSLEPSQLRSTRLSLDFLSPDATPPCQFGGSADVRKLSFAFLELTITG